ncbi:MAG: MgtC/SapB family protein [Bacteroidota bacterium]
MELTTLDFGLRICCALLCGLAIGFERQWHHKSAGLRTNTLVAVGSALFVILSTQLIKGEADPTRVLGQVVTGVGFLGAGIIYKEGLNIHGLTTAATIWCSSAIGCLAAVGYFRETFMATGIILFINALLLPLDNWLTNRKNQNDS